MKIKYFAIVLFLLLGGFLISAGDVIVKQGELNVTKGFRAGLYSSGDFIDYDVNDNTYYKSPTNSVYFEAPSGTPRMTIRGSSGNVGIGTMVPKAGLHVSTAEGPSTALAAGVVISGGPSGNANIELRNSGTGTPYIDFANDPSTSDYDMRIRLTGDDALAIEGGNVGIGTTSPNHKLHVTGETRTSAITLSAGGSWWHRSAGDVGIVSDGGNYKALMIVGADYDNTDGRCDSLRCIRMWDRVTVEGELYSTGNVGIGTTNPRAKLEVNGFIRSGCPSGWWSAAYGRVCMEKTERGATTMWNAIGICKGVGNGARVCTHNDFQQICGAGIDPYGASTGWYGDHGDNPNEGASNSDDDYLTWNRNYCSNNNDGPARGASAVKLPYHCCI